MAAKKASQGGVHHSIFFTGIVNELITLCLLIKLFVCGSQYTCATAHFSCILDF